MLNQKFRFVGIHFDSVKLEIALVKNSRDATRAMRYKRAMSLFRFVLRTDR
jgi:hypothetical protein